MLLISKIRELQRAMETEYCVFFSLSESHANDNVYYLMQEKIEPAILIIPKRGKPVLWVAGFEYERFKKTDGVRVRQLKKIKDALPDGTIGYDAREVTVKLYNRLRRHKTRDVSDIMRNLRLAKTDQEIKLLEKAAQLTAKIFEQIPKKRWTHEQQIRTFLYEETARLGGGPAFDAIVASGKDAANPHYQRAKKLTRGFCVIDYGVRYKGYRADVTRTFFVGKPNKSEREMYELVKTTQEACIQLYCAGKPIKDTHILAAKKLGDKLIHSLGHGIGLDIHEAPGIGPASKGMFQEGMVVTCEPGIYIKGALGIRIEDDLIITAKGPRRISHISRELKTI